MTKKISKQVTSDASRFCQISRLSLSLAIELDALGDELNFEEEEIPSYLQEDATAEELPKAAETDPKQVG